MIEDINNIIRLSNETLSEIELNIISQFKSPEKPVFFIVGAPRSGTTVLLQTIVDYYNVAYINNLVAKFWDAPVIGSIFYKSLEIEKKPQSFESESGFTKEVDGPHEFGYFWKRFFKYNETHQIDESAYSAIDHDILIKEIAGLESINKKPMIFKNPPALGLQIRFLNKYIPNSHFIYIKRNPYFTAQSIYLKRIEKLDDLKKWYSTKPMEYNQLKDESPVKQIAGQVYFTTKKIEADLENISEDRKTILIYEDFCQYPISAIDSCTKLSGIKIADKIKEAEDLRFIVKNKISMNQLEWTQMKGEIDKLFK